MRFVRTGRRIRGSPCSKRSVAAARRRSDAHISLAEMYAESNRGAQAVKLLQDAQAKFPGETAVAFELASVLEKQKRYGEAEVVFRQLLTRDPEHAPTLNYLGYMLAERGVRLDESVELIQRALKSQPDNGSYLDSLGWAYFKGGKFDLAEEHLKRAAAQLATNSVVQDHYGDVLVKLQRYDEAIAAWTRALAGDGDTIDRSDIDRKIRLARQKLPKRGRPAPRVILSWPKDQGAARLAACSPRSLDRVRAVRNCRRRPVRPGCNNAP